MNINWVVFLGILFFSGNMYSATIWVDLVGNSLSDNCSADEPFQAKIQITRNGIKKTAEYNGPCLSCMTEKSLFIEEGHERDFKICKNREIFQGYSVLKNCPEDKPLRNYLKECFSCGELHDIFTENSSDCDICGDMRKKKVVGESGKIYCVLNKSPDSKRPLVDDDRQGDYKLKGCYHDAPVKTNRKNCDLCSNRTWNEKRQVCVLKCLDDNKVATRNGCISRNEKYFEFWYPEECSNFPDYISLEHGDCISKGYFAGGCAALKDEIDCMRLYGMYGNGYRAYSCTDERRVYTEKIFCDLCPNREFVEDKWCVLKESK